MVIYLNGAEVARRSMPAGFVQHGTAALPREARAYETIDLAAFIRELRPGTNWIAARVHQDRPSSHDLVFDLAIRVGEVTALASSDSPPDRTARR